MKRSTSDLIWQEVSWSRPFTQNNVFELLSHLASLSPRKSIVWEIRASGRKVRYFIGTGRRYIKPLKSAFSAHGDIEFSEMKERTAVTSAKQLKISNHILPLETKNTLSVLKTALSALANTKSSETLAIQIILGDSVSKNLYSLIRIGAKAETNKNANGLLLSVMSAFRQFETAGVNLTFSNTDSENLNEVKIPWFLPLRLSIAELAGFVLLPCTDMELAGIGGLHPKLLRAPFWLKDDNNRSFAKSLGVNSKNLNIPIKDSLEHTVILGATGSGKSNIMLTLALEDIKAGRGVLVVDPKSDLINDILARIPNERIKDTVVIDPSDTFSPVGINPFLAQKSNPNPHLISDTILAIFKQIFNDSWGVFSQDVLSASLLTLANTQNATLLQLIPLLNDEHYRHSITKNITDVGLQQFWENFEAMSKSERRQVIAPVMNKLRQFTMRESLRNMLGQSKPKFKLSDLFEKNKIVLVSLNKGIVGADTAKLIGSLIIGMTWNLALNRAKIPAEKRHPVSVYIDELQDYISAISGDFESSLAMARGLGVGFCVCHQYRSQLTPAIKSAIDTNCRNKIVFNLNVADAKDMASMTTNLETADFMTLPRYHIYTQLQNNGKCTNWISGKTLSAPPPLRMPAELKAHSMKLYGQLEPDLIETKPLITTIGRRKAT